METTTTFIQIKQNANPNWCAISSITYIGKIDVWDIETEKYHTFFANDIGVHNCQQMDPDLELEISQAQAAFKNRAIDPAIIMLQKINWGK